MRIKILIFITLCLYRTALAQYNPDELAKAIGYYYGVELSLNHLHNKFPDLYKKINLASLDLYQAHGRTVEWIETEINKKLQISKEEFRNMMTKGFEQEYAFKEITYQEAVEILRNFKEVQIKGNDETTSSFVQILLKYHPDYIRVPLKEMLDGYRTVLHTDGHIKAKGLRLSLEYPKSWNRSEGKRPNILTVMNNHDKTCVSTIQVSDIFTSEEFMKEKPTTKDLQYFNTAEYRKMVYEDILTEENAREIISSYGLEKIDDFSFSKTMVDGEPALTAKASGILNRGLVNAPIHIIHNYIVYKNYIVQFGSIILAIDGKMDDEKEKYQLIPELMLNSIIFKDKWK